jgi:hypothetical protein
VFALNLNPLDLIGSAWDAVSGLFSGLWELAQLLADPVGAIVKFLGGALSAMLQWLVSTALYFAFSDTIANDVTGEWFMDVYGKSFYVGLLLLILGVVGVVAVSITKGRASLALRGLAVDVPIAAFGMTFALAFVAFFLRVCDEVSAFFLTGSTQEELRVSFSSIYSGSWFMDQSSFWLTFLTSIVLAISLFATIAILVVRTSIIYVAVALVPFAYAAYVFPALRGSLRRTVETIAALIFAKPAIALALTIGAACMGQVTDTGTQQQATQAFRFLDRGTLVYQDTFEVERVSIITSNGGRMTYDGPVETRGFLRFVSAVIELAMERTLNDFYNTAPAGNSGVAQRIFVRGQTIYQQDASCARFRDSSCPIGTLGATIDPDAERLYRVVVPTSVNEGELRALPDAADYQDALGRTRKVVFDRGFLESEIFLSEEGAGRTNGQQEISSQDLGLVSNVQWQRLESFLGYSPEGSRTATPAADVDPTMLCTRENVNASYGIAAPPETAGFCARVNTSGEVLVNGRRIGSLAPPERAPQWDFITMVAGIAIFSLTAATPFVILRLFPLLDAQLALAVLTDYGKSPMARGAQIQFNLGRINRLAGFLSRSFGSRGRAPSGQSDFINPERPASTGAPAPGSSNRFGSTAASRVGRGRK